LTALGQERKKHVGKQDGREKKGGPAHSHSWDSRLLTRPEKKGGKKRRTRREKMSIRRLWGRSSCRVSARGKKERSFGSGKRGKKKKKKRGSAGQLGDDRGQGGPKKSDDRTPEGGKGESNRSCSPGSANAERVAMIGDDAVAYCLRRSGKRAHAFVREVVRDHLNHREWDSCPQKKKKTTVRCTIPERKNKKQNKGEAEKGRKNARATGRRGRTWRNH